MKTSEKYKRSIFNEFVGSMEGGWVLYNNNTAAMISVSEHVFQALKNNNLDLLSPNHGNVLSQTGFIVEKNVNEVQSLHEKKKEIIENRSVIGLQILPTLECNFACPYCYEKMLDNHPRMTKEVMDGIIFWIKNTIRPGTQVLNIMWYGGEPLLAMEQINYLSHAFKEIISRGKISYYASIVTNGFLLDHSTISSLKNNGINSCMVTIDGPEEIHNRRRILEDGRGTWEKIIGNIKNAIDLGMNITIRVNIDKENIDHIESLVISLKEHGILERVGFCLGLVTRFGYACASLDDRLLTENEFKRKLDQANITEMINQGKSFMNRILPDLVGCVATAKYSYVVCPNGELYKCSKNIGNPEESCGSIFNPDENHPNYLKWINLDNLFDPLCSNCSLVPICRGKSCAYDILFNAATNHNCGLENDHEKYIDRLKRTYLNQYNQQTK